MNAEKKEKIHYVDGNQLNNRKNNLTRVCSKSNGLSRPKKQWIVNIFQEDKPIHTAEYDDFKTASIEALTYQGFYFKKHNIITRIDIEEKQLIEELK
jgi:hypothetical protein